MLEKLKKLGIDTNKFDLILILIHTIGLFSLLLVDHIMHTDLLFVYFSIFQITVPIMILRNIFNKKEHKIGLFKLYIISGIIILVLNIILGIRMVNLAWNEPEAAGLFALFVAIMYIASFIFFSGIYAFFVYLPILIQNRSSKKEIRVKKKAKKSVHRKQNNIPILFSIILAIICTGLINTNIFWSFLYDNNLSFNLYSLYLVVLFSIISHFVLKLYKFVFNSVLKKYKINDKIIFKPLIKTSYGLVAVLFFVFILKNLQYILNKEFNSIINIIPNTIIYLVGLKVKKR